KMEHHAEEGCAVRVNRRDVSWHSSAPHVKKDRSGAASDTPEEQEKPPISPDEHVPSDGWEEQKAGDELGVETQFDGGEAHVEQELAEGRRDAEEYGAEEDEGISPKPRAVRPRHATRTANRGKTA